ncbi:MAG: hypothetical protein JXN59_12635 [Anaerolineae bacterium]|nr:hypothetical protein [Anaerolineae bacterium]
MYPQMQNSRRRATWIVWVIPVVLICCLAVWLLAPALPGVILRFVGFTPKGNVETFWQEQATQATPVSVIGGLPPAPPVVAGSTPAGLASTPTPVAVAGATATPGSNGAVTGTGYTGWFQSSAMPQTLTITSTTGRVSTSIAEAYVSDARFGMGVDGFPLGVIRYQENAIDGICATWLRGCATDQFQLTSVDFRVGGMVVYGAVNAGGITQSLGIVLTLGADAKSVVPQGVVLGGQLYAVPQSGDIASYVSEAISRSNAALGQLQVQADGLTLGLVQMQFADEGLTLIFR